MKKLFLFLLLITMSGLGVYFYQRPELLKNFFRRDHSAQPGFVASTKTINTVWNPTILGEISKIPPPVIDSKAAIAAEITTSKILYTKNPDLRLPVGSIQKIVTAMVALDHKNESDIVTVSPNASSREPDSMGLFPGEKLTLKQLLYGLILVSGNDAATAVAESVSGDEKTFSLLMTQKAKNLGLDNSLFINSNGLDEGEQYSTAGDLATLAVNLEKYYPLLAEIVAAKTVTIPNTVDEIENHKAFYLSNTSPMIEVPGYLGIKPGYTPNAGLCLMSLVERNGKKYLIITLGSNDRKGDTEALLDYAGLIYP